MHKCRKKGVVELRIRHCFMEEKIINLKKYLDELEVKLEYKISILRMYSNIDDAPKKLLISIRSLRQEIDKVCKELFDIRSEKKVLVKKNNNSNIFK